jgi:hypothetical protein
MNELGLAREAGVGGFYPGEAVLALLFFFFVCRGDRT